MKDKIRELREAKGMTQKELADALGINQSAVARWETGENEPTAFNVRRIADVLGTSPGELF